LTEIEEGFLESVTDRGYEGINDDDPVFQWQMGRAKRDARVRQATGMSFKEARAKVGDIELKMDALKPVTAEEEALADAYHKAMSVANRRRRPGGDDAPYIAALVNTGWTDQARVAALAVRRAKAGMRGQVVRAINPDAGPPPDNGIYLGGSKYFDEASGQYVYPQPGRGVPPGWAGKPAYPVRLGRGSPPPYRPGPVLPPGWPGKPTVPRPPVRPRPPKKGTPVPIKTPYGFLNAGARRFGAGAR
jgi:hypothetical protein